MLSSSFTFGYGAVSTLRQTSKSSKFANAYARITKRPTVDLEARALSFQPNIKYFDDFFVIKKPALSLEHQGHPNRKPQPNRGPRGRKDWK